MEAATAVREHVPLAIKPWGVLPPILQPAIARRRVDLRLHALGRFPAAFGHRRGGEACRGEGAPLAEPRHGTSAYPAPCPRWSQPAPAVGAAPACCAVSSGQGGPRCGGRAGCWAMAPRPPQPGADDDFIVGRIHHHWLGLELPGEKNCTSPTLCIPTFSARRGGPGSGPATSAKIW